MRLKLKKYKQEGDLAWQYQPFHNMMTENNQITDFDTNELDIDMSNPLSIECQPSYDGTVNLIINDDKNPPRIINSRFTKIEDNRYRVITRNQKEQTNLYKEGKVDSQTRLFRNLNHIPQVDLRGVSYYGQLKGGLYTFYVKFADNDYNKTDIVCESSQIPIFKGTISNPSTISGTIVDEITDKSIRLRVSNIDTSFQKIYLYYTRETCDTNGIKVIKATELIKPYEINNDYVDITINGFEEEKEISVEELNIQYNLASTVKTQAQVQNMLFFGNITDPKCNNTILQNLSYYIKVSTALGDDIGSITDSYKNVGASISKTEYYNPQNIYYKLGYWPDEIYRLGIVYILNDDSLSPVYNLRGCVFFEDKTYNYEENSEYGQLLENMEDENSAIKYLPKQEFLYDDSLENTIGVFKTPKNVNIYEENETKPLYFKMELSSLLLMKLHEQKIKGYFFVRQKRIPTILGEGLSVGINKNCYIPMLYDTTKVKSGLDENGEQIMKDYGYFSESFLSNAEQKLTSSLSARTLKYYDPTKGNYNNTIQSSALLSLDAAVTPLLQSNYDGSEFVLEKIGSKQMKATGRHYSYIEDNEEINDVVTSINSQVIYVDENIPLRMMDSYGFCTRAGEAEDVSQLTFFNEVTKEELENPKPALVRGIYCPLLGTNVKLDPASIYRIKIHNYSEAFIKEYFLTRGNDKSSFFAVSDRFELNPTENSIIDVYRGDCYTSTVTMRFNRNFIDPDVPIDDTIVDEDTWRDNFLGVLHVDDTKPLEKLGKTIKNAIKGKEDDPEYTDYTKINRADINAVPLGVWVTFKCLSNYNLGIRALDERYFDEHAKMGNARTFYPVSDISTKSSYKIPESFLLNEGYSVTQGERRNFIYEDVPYIKDQFDNRIIFSNVQEEDAFRNAYRIFQGLSYQDIDRQYGSIVKLIPWKENLLCVFEHGIGIVPVNQKALMSTTTGQSIHLYGAGVLQSQVSVISSDFGSIWQESIIRTPIGVYGVDTTAKKIWRYSDQKGFEIISDFKVQRFLNDHIALREKDKYPTISLLNVKTHFNNFKGDVMFTFYNNEEDETWNLCFNERIDKWVTRYSWTPLYSENINNLFCSFDRERAKVFAHIYDNRNCTYGLRTENQTWQGSTYTTHLWLEGYSLSDNFDINIKSAKYSYLDNDDIERFVNLNLAKISYNNINKTLSVNLGQESHKVYYIIIQLDIIPIINNLRSEFVLKETIGAVRELTTDEEKEDFKKLLGNGVYIHGRAGIFDELNYFNEKLTDQCMTTYWYDKQEPFEFEFVVNGDVGLHKIFNDLVIISNNVQPHSLEFEVTGDAYNFNKAGLYWEDKNEKWDETDTTPNREWDVKYNKIIDNKYQLSQELDPHRTEVVWDNILNTYSIKVHQNCRNIKEYGRIKGNIYYKEDSFYTNIEPIVFKNKVKFVDSDQVLMGRAQSTRVRDKFCKIRVKYTGEDIVIITALKTMLQITYA